jgi:hypothetical protein
MRPRPAALGLIKHADLFRVGEVAGERINASRKINQHNNGDGRKNKKSEQHT